MINLLIKFAAVVMVVSFGILVYEIVDFFKGKREERRNRE